MTSRLRDAIASDHAAVAALWREMDEIHARLQPRFFRRPPDGVPQRERERFERLLASRDEIVRLAVDGDGDGAVVGLCHAQLYDTPPQPTLTPCRRLHIDSLIVDPRARRRGIGRALLDDAAAWGRRRGASQLVLTVWAGNDEAERFYRALGFEIVSAALGRAL